MLLRTSEKFCRLIPKIVHAGGRLGCVHKGWGGISWMWRNPKAEHQGSQILNYLLHCELKFEVKGLMVFGTNLEIYYANVFTLPIVLLRVDA